MLEKKKKKKKNRIRIIYKFKKKKKKNQRNSICFSSLTINESNVNSLRSSNLTAF